MPTASITFEDESIKNRHMSTTAEIARSKLAQVTNGIHNVRLTDARVWDAMATVLTGTAGTDDLALVTGTLATDMPSIQAGDLKAAGATTRYCSFLIPVPAWYEDAETVTLRAVAGMKTTVADTSCTIDFQVYKNADDGTVGSDICATSATTMNSLTAAAKDFTITATTLVKGDMLHARMAITCTDAATATAVIPRVVAVKLLADLR